VNAPLDSAEELPVLWQLRFSHYNEKGRWALDYKKVPHRRRSLVPGRHSIRSRRLGGRGTTPMLQIDAKVIGDTTEIVAELEQRNPDPPLYPDGEIDRGTALELEDHFDRELGPQLRSAVFASLVGDRHATVEVTTQGLAARERVLANALWPLLKTGIKRVLPADAEAGRRGRDAIVAALDKIESELHGDYLVGDRFSVADLTAAALLFPLTSPPQFAYQLPARWPEDWEEFRSSLSDRPAYRWALEMFARHRGTSAAVSDD
jgi:glutathione S-transferase